MRRVNGAARNVARHAWQRQEVGRTYHKHLGKDYVLLHGNSEEQWQGLDSGSGSAAKAVGPAQYANARNESQARTNSRLGAATCWQPGRKSEADQSATLRYPQIASLG